MRPSVPVAGSATHSRAATSTQTHGPPSTGPRAPCTPRRAIRANSAWGARRASCHELPLARMLPQLPRRRRRAFPPASLRSSLTCGWYSRSGARRQRLNAAIHLSVHALETVQGFGGPFPPPFPSLSPPKQEPISQPQRVKALHATLERERTAGKRPHAIRGPLAHGGTRCHFPCWLGGRAASVPHAKALPSSLVPLGRCMQWRGVMPSRGSPGSDGAQVRRLAAVPPLRSGRANGGDGRGKRGPRSYTPRRLRRRVFSAWSANAWR